MKKKQLQSSNPKESWETREEIGGAWTWKTTNNKIKNLKKRKEKGGMWAWETNNNKIQKGERGHQLPLLIEKLVRESWKRREEVPTTIASN
jgi:hypothetical protein